MVVQLPAAPNPNDLRNAILARLGLTPDKAAGFAGNTAFDDQINNYYRAAAGGMSGLDLNEQRLGTDYETQLAEMMLQRDRARRTMEDMFADRGMLSSSNFTDELSRFETDYGNRLQGLTQNRTRGLEDINRGRNEILEEFNRNRQTTEGEYAQQLQDYLLAQVRPPVAAPAAPMAAPRMAAPAPRPTVRSVSPVRAQAAPQVRAPAPAAPRVVAPTVPRPQVSLRALERNPAYQSAPAPRRPTSSGRTVRAV